MTIITSTIGKAMATQLDRVNDDSAYLRNKVERIQTSNEELRRKWREAQTEINRLQIALDEAQRKLSMIESADSDSKHPTHNGRPVMTVKQAVKQTGIPAHTIYRYLRSGHWAAAEVAGQYRIYADQPLTRKTPKKRGRKKQ